MATTMGSASAPMEAEKERRQGLAATISTATTKKRKKSQRDGRAFLGMTNADKKRREREAELCANRFVFGRREGAEGADH